MNQRRRTIYGAAALALLLFASVVGGASPASAADRDVAVGSDGSVATDAGFAGPQVTQIRVLQEGRFLEIYWDRYVDETAAVSAANITLTNGTRTIGLVSKPASGRTDTIFFDSANRQIAATAANSMARLPKDLHMASVAYTGVIDPTQPLTVSIKGTRITDAGGAAAQDATYRAVPQLSYYSQSITTDDGIVVKGGPRVQPEALAKAAAQVDVQLALSTTGIAARMADEGCSLAVYGARENAYLVPEHRFGYDPAMYDVEGYGGNRWNNCVSSISERNVLRTRGASDRDLNTGYTNENILIHEFGHAVRSVGIDTLADSTLANAFAGVYQNARTKGLWPNTYAISNSDEYFATLSAVWFSVMAESRDWRDGVRSPINTRAELKAYDPVAYDFFARIYPSNLALPAPWEQPSPDDFHGDLTPITVTYTSAGQQVRSVAAFTPFVAPAITNVEGADWSRKGYVFAGWRLPGQTKPLPSTWAPPAGSSAITLVATWQAPCRWVTCR